MNRAEMRRCGKRYRTEDEALRSKAGRVAGAEVTSCRCDGYHVARPAAPRGDGKPRKPVNGNTIPAKVCDQVDGRDGRQCVKCGGHGAIHRHHRRLKGQGGDTRPHTDCACNLVLLCLMCHFWVHVEDRRTAEAEGLILPGSETEPWKHGVMVHSTDDAGVTRWPRCDGTYGDSPEGLAA